MDSAAAVQRMVSPDDVEKSAGSIERRLEVAHVRPPMAAKQKSKRGGVSKSTRRITGTRDSPTPKAYSKRLACKKLSFCVPTHQRVKRAGTGIRAAGTGSGFVRRRSLGRIPTRALGRSNRRVAATVRPAERRVTAALARRVERSVRLDREP